MAATGGDIREVTYNHPTLGSGILHVKGSTDNNYDLGGLRGDDDDDSVTGAGTNIRKLNQKRWYVELAEVEWDMNNGNQLELMKALAADPVEATWTFDHINSTIYGGIGSPVGDLKGNTNAATFPLKISGGGGLKKI